MLIKVNVSIKIRVPIKYVIVLLYLISWSLHQFYSDYTKYITRVCRIVCRTQHANGYISVEITRKLYDLRLILRLEKIKFLSQEVHHELHMELAFWAIRAVRAGSL